MSLHVWLNQTVLVPGSSQGVLLGLFAADVLTVESPTVHAWDEAVSFAPIPGLPLVRNDLHAPLAVRA